MLTAPNRQLDNAAVERRADVMVFTDEPLAADLDAVGPVRARIHLRTEHPYADLFIRLCDVDEWRRSRNVVDGIRRLDPGAAQDGGIARGPDGALAVDLELSPTAYRFRKGHRLRVQVSGGAFPRYARNLGTGEPFSTGRAMRDNRFEILHDAEHPSYVELSVRPA